MRERDGMRTALLISGGGTTAEAVIQASRNGELLGINPVVVIANTSKAKGLEKAERLGVPTQVILKSRFEPQEAFGDGLLKQLKSYGVDLVSQNGWLPLTPANVVDEYKGRIINQHPGPLDPGGPIDFGGKGMHATAAVAARVAYCWSSQDDCFTESTVHFVSEEEYDRGSLISVMRMEFPRFRKVVTVAEIGTDFEQLLKQQVTQVQKRLLPIEHQNVIAALRKFGGGMRPKGFKRPYPLVPSDSVDVAKQAKELAVQLYSKP